MYSRADACTHARGPEGSIEFEAERDHPEAARRAFAYMLTDAEPALLGAGFSEAQIQTFLVDNPRRFFERSGGGQ